MDLQFCKMEGAGNDYIYLNCLESQPPDPAGLAVRLSDRHFGIGSDGLVLICASSIADFQMKMYNRDGSQGNMCGNAIRCMGKYVYDRGLTSKRELSIETKCGVKRLSLHLSGNEKVRAATVRMGRAEFGAEKIPVRIYGLNEVIDHPLSIGGDIYRITCVSMGNLHCAVFCDDVDSIRLDRIGPLLEKHPAFPQGVNTEFIQRLSSDRLKMRVWERGSGETLACGTGACAAAAACVKNGFSSMDTPVHVSLRGGELTILVKEDDVLMTGPATHVFDGVIQL